MAIPPIDWAGFTWEAFATLTTGVAAVAAAVAVGLRQAKIAERQTTIADRQSRILERQVGLDELKLRSELFEQRFGVYESTRKFLAAIMAHADEPERTVQHEYLVGMDQAKFLFRPEVRTQLKEIWEKACAFFAVKSVMTAQYRQTGDYGAENINREHELLGWLTGKLENLSELFGDELKLSAGPGPEAVG